MENLEPESNGTGRSALKYGDRILAICGYILIMASVACFGVVAYIKLQDSLNKVARERYLTWLDFLQAESATLSLILVALVTALLGKRLLISVHLSDARTIPYDDLPLVRQAVIDGKPEPIDQYVRLRSLSGMSGNFTKLGITGLPLTTVALTLIFSFISLLGVETSADFLDLAKLTLGAFIGSFVQRQVDLRRQDTSQPPGTIRRPDLPT
jgi:hypothetical protein